MIKSQFISSMASKASPFSDKDVEFVVNGILDIIKKAVLNGERVEIRGFGSISLRRYQRRTARNPKTGKLVIAPETFALHFIPGKTLKDRVLQQLDKDK